MTYGRQWLAGILGMLPVIAVTIAVVAPEIFADRFENPKVAPPRAKRHRRSAGESLPPLPLPATPLRRSERKRQPSPPALVGLIGFAQTSFKMVDGERVRVKAFPTTQVDIEPLIHHVKNKLHIDYRYMSSTLDKFSWDPTELPILYITGWTPLPEIKDETLAKLQRYLYDGGTLVLHAQCGRSEFYQSAQQQVQRIFPKRNLVMIDSDSPLFHACYDIENMRIRDGEKKIVSVPPLLKAMYLGCRPAVIISEIDLNCSWDIQKNPIPGGRLYHRRDGLALGTNIVTTVLANLSYARTWGHEKIYPETGASARDQLVLAQVVHSGDWDPTPHALPNLMKYIQNETTLNVQFKRNVVKLTDTAVFEHPVLYMTGLHDFTLTDQEIGRLKKYLASGGVLVADAAAGRKAFDVAFRREIKKALPGKKLAKIDLKSPLYSMPYRIERVDYTELFKEKRPKCNTPQIEGITIDGQLAVIYSAEGLSCGWEHLGFAYNRGYADRDALRLGVNIISYLLTH